MKLSTHRVIQLSQLANALSAISAQCERASANAASIRNVTMAARFAVRSQRAKSIASRALGRLERDCGHRMELAVERRPGNALNVEIGAPVPRCNRKSPDGRGLAWLLSGGDSLSYGHCTPRACPAI